MASLWQILKVLGVVLGPPATFYTGEIMMTEQKQSWNYWLNLYD